MGSPYYTPSGTPATNAQGSSSDIRSEFNLVETALDKMPTLTASYIVRVNSGGTSLEPVEKVPVANGGTGVSTLTDGGILLGSGTGNITATAVLADGEMIVGDGTTDPSIESGATLRTSIGVGTGDTVTFDGLTLTSTPLNVASGGTGLTALADGEIIVGDGVGNPVAESGATLRTSIGVGTGDTVDFSSLKINGITQFNAVSDHFYRNT